MSGPLSLFPSLGPPVVADKRLSGHVLHRVGPGSAEHRLILGAAADGRILGVRCASTGRADTGAEVEELRPGDWPALARLLAARAALALPPVARAT